MLYNDDDTVDPPPTIRSPSDILAEEAANLKREQDAFLAKCNEKLPRKRGEQGRISVQGVLKDVYGPSVTELKRVGWEVEVSFYTLVIRFPQEVSAA